LWRADSTPSTYGALHKVMHLEWGVPAISTLWLCVRWAIIWTFLNETALSSTFGRRLVEECPAPRPLPPYTYLKNMICSSNQFFFDKK